ncbi:MAG: transposase [Trueperaceae bacterium]
MPDVLHSSKQNKGLQPLVPADSTELKAFHIVWVTHSSRVSERMVTFGVKRSEPIILNETMEYEITIYIKQIVLEDKLNVLAYAICQDHVHMFLVCSDVARDNIVRKLKGKSAQLYKANHQITDRYTLWAQKYHWEELTTDAQFENTLNYVTYNRQKHNLPTSEKLQELVDSMIVTAEDVFQV